jgi:hypothetical protein
MRRLLLAILLAVIAAISGIVGFGMLVELFNGSRDNAIEVYLVVGLVGAAMSIAALVGLVRLWRG